jgi:hypothetical protein
MGENSTLIHEKLVRKCVALVMATTCARFTEIQQFLLEDSNPTADNSRWDFNVRVKNREYLQPIVLHRMHHPSIDPIQAMCELRERVRKIREKCEIQNSIFWCDVRGTVMRIDEIRHAAQQLLADAGINDKRAYHIKHATISWLHKQGVPSDQIIRFIRHSLGSTTYMEYYLSEDLGAKCTDIIESTTMESSSGDEGAPPHEKEEEAEQGDAWVSISLPTIVASIDSKLAEPLPEEHETEKKNRIPRASKT